MRKPEVDPFLFLTTLALLSIGLVMVASSSLTLADNWKLPTLYFANRQAIAIFIGIMAGLGVSCIPLNYVKNCSQVLLLLSILLLSLLLVPGVSREVNGSVRWLYLGPISIQISEFAKLSVIIYIAGFLIRREQEVRQHLSGFLKPIVLVGLIAGLLLLEPDFGAAVVMMATIMGMLFLGGVPFIRFLALFALIALGLGILSIASPYRMARFTAFMNPWEDQFNTGYQLTQSLIAFGRGGWFGMGLGNSVQKLLYLPEPHTDFLYAVLAEELGLMGALFILLFFSILVWRIFKIGRRAMESSEPFHGYLAYGIALWIGLQTAINIGVNVGVLPTKGLTLPLMSYGGSSMIAGLIAIGLVFRIDYELRLNEVDKRRSLLGRV